MFLHHLEASDPRFKRVDFHPGLNLVVARRTKESGRGDSRNGTGKTSLVLILRYLMGGGLSQDLQSDEIKHLMLKLTAQFPGYFGSQEVLCIERPISPQTNINLIEIGDLPAEVRQLKISEWRDLLGRRVFSLPDDAPLTPGPLWSQLIRTEFGKPTKTTPSEADWLTGLKLGYFLGMSPEPLALSGAVAKMRNQRKALAKLVEEGGLSHLAIDDGEVRSQLAAARKQRDQIHSNLADFKVDDQYEQQQAEADRLSSLIRDLNNEELATKRRLTTLQAALSDESAETHEGSALAEQVAAMYGELGLVLPDRALRRYEQVEQFHNSVVSNRRIHLENELAGLTGRLDDLRTERSELDAKRSSVMVILQSSMALETFLEAQGALAQLDKRIAELETAIANSRLVSSLDSKISIAEAEATQQVQSELSDRDSFLDGPISLFQELGREIYDQRTATLSLRPSARNGSLSVLPSISGDRSVGIRGVESFILDLVLLITAMPMGRAPAFLVHDSHLFDAVDHRQVASCLSIGARLAAEHGFQYIVTMNSDFLESVERQGDFRRDDYLVPIELTDEREDGGIFGFNWE